MVDINLAAGSNDSAASNNQVNNMTVGSISVSNISSEAPAAIVKDKRLVAVVINYPDSFKGDKFYEPGTEVEVSAEIAAQFVESGIAELKEVPADEDAVTEATAEAEKSKTTVLVIEYPEDYKAEKFYANGSEVEVANEVAEHFLVLGIAKLKDGPTTSDKPDEVKTDLGTGGKVEDLTVKTVGTPATPGAEDVTKDAGTELNKGKKETGPKKNAANLNGDAGTNK